MYSSSTTVTCVADAVPTEGFEPSLPVSETVSSASWDTSAIGRAERVVWTDGFEPSSLAPEARALPG